MLPYFSPQERLRHQCNASALPHDSTLMHQNTSPKPPLDNLPSPCQKRARHIILLRIPHCTVRDIGFRLLQLIAARHTPSTCLREFDQRPPMHTIQLIPHSRLHHPSRTTAGGTSSSSSGRGD